MAKGPYGTLLGVFQRYRRDYGGIQQILVSPFFHLSALFGAIIWADSGPLDWHILVVAAFPTVLGFSLAAYTLTFAFMGSSLHQALSAAIHPQTNTTLLRMVNATFFHVVFIQASVLIYAIVSQSTILWELLVSRRALGLSGEHIFSVLRSIDDFVGSTLMVYGLTLMISVTVAMFRLGTIGRRGTPTAPPDTQPTPTPPSEPAGPENAPTSASSDQPT